MSEESPQPAQPNPHKPRINLQELRNCDLVSRFLAATPPYLYAASTGPNNFFFSEMLRSLVQARTNEQHTNRKQPNHIPANSTTAAAIPPIRRNRKRMWTQQRIYDVNSNEYKEIPALDTNNKSMPPEKPLELTNKMQATHSYPSMAKYQKSESPRMLPPDNVLNQKPIRIDHQSQQSDLKPNINSTYQSGNDSQQSHSNQSQHLEPPTAEIPSSELVLPPPPPMWYPPLYPPYGIDPLHFFIDLRVSGHIYDRKKENISPNNINHTSAASAHDNNNESSSIVDHHQHDTTASIGKHRHGSAFSVPPPRRDNNKSPLSSALNLTFSQPEKLNDFNNQQQQQYYERQTDLKDTKNNTQYVMQNLPKIYTNLLPQHSGGGGGDERNSVHSAEESDSKSESDVQDIDVKDNNHLLMMRNQRSPCNSIVGDQDDSNDVVIVDNKSN